MTTRHFLAGQLKPHPQSSPPTRAMCSAPGFPASPGAVDTLRSLHFISTEQYFTTKHSCRPKSTQAHQGCWRHPVPRAEHPPISQGRRSGSPVHLAQPAAAAGRHQATPSFPPCFGESNTKGEHVSYRSGPHVHGVPVAQPSAVPTAPGVHLSSGGQGQVVVTVRMGSDFDDVSGDKTLDELWGLKGEKREDNDQWRCEDDDDTAGLSGCASHRTALRDAATRASGSCRASCPATCAAPGTGTPYVTRLPCAWRPRVKEELPP